MALVEIEVAVQRVAPATGAVHVVDGADVSVERADGTAVAVWQNQAGTVPAALPLKSQNGRISGWVEEGLLLRYRATHPSLDPAAPWEFFTSGGGPVGATGPTGATGPEGPAGGLLAPGAHVSRARVAGTSYQPSTTRPVLVIATLFIETVSARGEWRVQVGNVNPPTVVVAQTSLRNDTASTVVVDTPVTFLVPTGQWYRLTTAVLTGAPQFVLRSVFEQAL